MGCRRNSYLFCNSILNSLTPHPVDRIMPEEFFMFFEMHWGKFLLEELVLRAQVTVIWLH